MTFGMADSESYRAYYAELVTASAGGCDDPILRAFRAIPREPFVGRGPWWVPAGDGYISTPTDDPVFIYQDVVVALDETHGIHNGQPSLHVRCLNAVRPRPGERVIHVGAGSGYYTTILASLVGKNGAISAFEVEPGLATRCKQNLLDWPSVRIHNRSALVPPIGAAEVIYVNAGLPYPPALWLDALRPGGRLIFPLTPGSDWGAMLKITRSDKGYAAEFLGRAIFIPCVAEATEGAAQALTSAFARGGSEKVRSLRRAPEAPDESCWLAGRDWWLSTAPP